MLILDIPSEMIVFDSSLESWIDKTIKSHCKLEKDRGVPSSVYFLIGSFCSDGDIHIAYHAKCPHPDSATDSVSCKRKQRKQKALEEQSLCEFEAGDKLSKSIDDEWIADCAHRVTRTLPGGTHIVGLAWYSNKAVYSDNKGMLTRALARVQRTNNSLTMLNIGNVNDSMALVFVETPNGKPVGQIIDVVKRGPDTPTKVNFTQLEWISVVTNASTKVNLNVPMRGKDADFYHEFAAALRPFVENLFSCDLMLIDGALRENSEPLFKDLKKKKASSVEVQLFIDPTYNKENMCTTHKATNLHEITFDVEIRAAVPAKSKVEAVKAAAKQHLVRSLMTRAELQYESMDVTEEAQVSGQCAVHQLPRPATTLLPCNGSILVAEYLFEADSAEDAQKNFEELLDLKTSIEHVDEGWERALLTEEMESVRSPLDDSPVVSLKPKDDDISAMPFFIVLGIIIAIISIIVYFATGRSN